MIGHARTGGGPNATRGRPVPGARRRAHGHRAAAAIAASAALLTVACGDVAERGAEDPDARGTQDGGPDDTRSEGHGADPGAARHDQGAGDDTGSGDGGSRDDGTGDDGTGDDGTGDDGTGDDGTGDEGAGGAAAGDDTGHGDEDAATEAADPEADTADAEDGHDEAVDGGDPSDTATEDGPDSEGQDERSDDDPGNGAPALNVEATDEGSADDGEPDGDLVVTDVRVGSHDGFDRVTFEFEGDAAAGWVVSYPDEATSQGSGEPVELAGGEVVGVALRNVTLPPELPPDLEAYDGPERIDPPGDAEVLEEVVEDTVFEGIHLFHLGVDPGVQHRVDRLEDPQRVVVDLLHDE